MIETLPPPEDDDIIPNITPPSPPSEKPFSVIGDEEEYIEKLEPVDDDYTVIIDGVKYKKKKSDIELGEKEKKKTPVWVWIFLFFIFLTVGFIVLIYQGFSTPDINLAKFIISPEFNWFLVTIFTLIIFAPFGIYGIYHFWSWFQNEFMKARSGYMKVRRKLGNDRWKVFWKKPIGSKITAKTEDGINIEIPIKLKKDYMGWEGNIPFIELDDNLAQMPLNRTKLTIPQEHSTRMSYLAYLAGKISALKESQNLQLLLIIAIIAICAIGGFNAWVTYNVKDTQTKMDARVSDISNMVSQLKNQTSPTPPTVGG